jgi:hypothetical protein
MLGTPGEQLNCLTLIYFVTHIGLRTQVEAFNSRSKLPLDDEKALPICFLNRHDHAIKCRS